MYSNIDLKTEQELAHFKIIPIQDEKAEIFSYRIQFDNCIEHQSGGLSLIDVGSDVVIYQLKHVLSFLFDAYFDIDKHIVENMCREKITNARMKKVPSNYVRMLLEKDRIAEQKEIYEVQQSLQNLIALKRSDYENIMECIRSYCGSIKLLEEDPNLAYCVGICFGVVIAGL